MADNVNDPTMMCAVCGLTLSHMRTLLGASLGWGHPTERVGLSDHVAVPVPYDESLLVSLCDFCNDQVELADRLYLPVADFELGMEFQHPTRGTHFELYRNRGGYQCCRDCAALVAADDWDGLEKRYMGRHPSRHGMSQPLKLIWDETRKHITGPIRPWQYGDHITEDRP